MEEIVFLTLAEVVIVHMDQIERYGGKGGIRETGMLQSAIAMPEASFGGEWLHTDLFEMAAAYAFHISQNQLFWDGNKRTALACALLFLEFNGISVIDKEKRLYQAMSELALGHLNKKVFAEILRDLPKE